MDVIYNTLSTGSNVHLVRARKNGIIGIDRNKYYLSSQVQHVWDILKEIHSLDVKLKTFSSDYFWNAENAEGAVERKQELGLCIEAIKSIL